MPAPVSTNGLAADELLAPAADLPRIDGVVVATVTGFDAGGAPRVTFPGNPLRRPVSARSAVAIAREDIGRDVAVSFEQGDPGRPIIIGRLWQPEPAPTVTTVLDRERLVLSADKEIVLE